MNGALSRYRVMAYVVGVGLLVLVLVGVPLEHFAERPGVVSIVGPAHGFLYIVYLVFALDLAMRARWPLGRTLGVLVAGTIPFLSFVVERRVARWMTDTDTAANADAGTNPKPGAGSVAEPAADGTPR